MNFLNETRDVLASFKLNTSDIIFIGSESSGHQCTWAEFETLAVATNRVSTDLIIVFADGTRMHRGEYDGSEWWEVTRPFVRPAITKPITCLSELEGINSPEKE